ncbi:DUF6377 domain-containing protein [Arcticibacter eurypsychrophilus]|uniref:DUF6377 domain-containing protein n=1 Tax=Arcticibacter eurypsychrophilus TaxID=1434752 RepID=UPI001FDF0952|nr:DUF6377 domain-containing protein [Arcticibacter eurypsychrophilus]
MMKPLFCLSATKEILILILLFLSNPVWSQFNFDQSLARLNKNIARKNQYDDQKLARITSLEKSLKSRSNQNLVSKYAIYSKLYDEYKSFNYDKAFFYAHRMQESGQKLNDPVKMATGKIKLGFVLLSAGMFKETFDSLKTVQVGILPDSTKKDFYYLNAHTYYDLADFDKDKFYTPLYNRKAETYIDSALALSNPKSYDYQYNSGLKLIKGGKNEQGAVYLKNLINHYPLNDHQVAVTYSTLSDIYIRKNDPDKAIDLLLQAAEADISYSTKEAAAMLNLAMLLYQKGDIKNAYAFINQAMKDATYYGARHRKVQVSNALIVIAGGKVNSVEQESRNLIIFVVLLTLLVVVVILFVIIISRQLERLKKADKIILETNKSLQDTIHQLTEAEKIKEQYIGYFFNLISEYITKLDKFKKSVSNKLVTKKFDDIQKLVSNINLKDERDELFLNFDKAFLTLFPNFVETYNSFFEPEHQVTLRAGQLMNTDMRIFALIRLGITENEKISSILEYSMNTIYNYKARIKNKSKIANEDFEKAILSIKAV